MNDQCLSKEPVDFTPRGTCRSQPAVSLRQGRIDAATTADALGMQGTADGWLRYCLTGLLALQHLYCKEIREKSHLEFVTMEQKISATANEKTTGKSGTTDKRDETVCIQGISQDFVDAETNSLLGSAVRSLQIEMLKYRRLVEDIEGIDHKGIVTVCIYRYKFPFHTSITETVPFDSSDIMV